MDSYEFFDSYDGSMKCLIEREPAAILRYGSGLTDLQVEGPEPAALPATDRSVDAGYRILHEGRPLVAHIEFHRRKSSQAELATDIAEAQLRFHRRQKLPVVSLLWDLYGSKRGPLFELRTYEFTGYGGEVQSRCVYRRINIRALTHRELLEQAPPALWPLVPLTRDGDELEAVSTAKQAICERKELSDSHRADHLAVLRFMAEAEGLPRQALRLYISEDELMQSEFYREIWQKGEQVGLQKGEQLGLHKGELKIYRKTIVRMLANRLGSAEPRVKDKIERHNDRELLEQWYIEALGLVTSEDARRLAEKIRQAPEEETTG